ncbi:MAG: hypothetical protein Q8J70_02465 [Thiobacillus sp.]|nr:hypothetical protein [Thiobacillus sp.]
MNRTLKEPLNRHKHVNLLTLGVAMKSHLLVLAVVTSLFSVLSLGAYAAEADDSLAAAGERIRQTGAQLQADIKKARERLEAQEAREAIERKRAAERERQQAITEEKQRHAQEVAQVRARREEAARAEQAERLRQQQAEKAEREQQLQAEKAEREKKLLAEKALRDKSRVLTKEEEAANRQAAKAKAIEALKQVRAANTMKSFVE